MRNAGIRLHLNGLIFLVMLTGILVLEYQIHFIERSVGLYLKWQNISRPQLGRMWDRDRENLVAQHKIQSILSSLDLEQQSAESLGSFKEIFDRLLPGASQVVSRAKFLQLYYDYPGEWSYQMISSLDLVNIDSGNNWSRVLFTRRGSWVTISFIDRENLPIDVFHVSLESLDKIHSSRVIRKGSLEELGFSSERLFPFAKFVQILKTLDPDSQRQLFPDPQWFLEKGYHITRIGFSDILSNSGFSEAIIFGIEYQTDYYPGVLQIHVPLEMAHNILSQIEKDDRATSGNPSEDT